MNYISPGWQKVLDEQAIETKKEEARLEQERKQWEKKMKDNLATSFKADVEPKAATEIAQGPERQIAKSGENFLTIFSSLDGDAPLLYVVKKTGNKERVAFPVLNGNSFAALQSAFKLFENRVSVIGSSRPADIM